MEHTVSRDESRAERKIESVRECRGYTISDGLSIEIVQSKQRVNEIANMAGSCQTESFAFCALNQDDFACETE